MVHFTLLLVFTGPWLNGTGLLVVQYQYEVSGTPVTVGNFPQYNAPVLLSSTVVCSIISSVVN